MYQARIAADVDPDDGLPLPSPRLRVLVSGTADSGSFLAGGRATAEILSACVDRAGRDIREMEALLDFGCGCGRVARHWQNFTNARIFGSDYNPQLVAWVRDSLPHVTAAENRFEPPLPFEAASFDLVYAVSVFTHLTEGLQRRWIGEIARVVKPGGLVVFTTHGEEYLDRLRPAERERFRGGEIVVQFDEVEGSNWCAAFHPERYVREGLLHSSPFVLRDFRPGVPESYLPQDAWTAARVVPTIDP